MTKSNSKTLASALAALTLGGALLATSAPAEAGYYWRHRHYGGYGYGYGGGALAAGLIGGLALGAMAASAANAQPVYAAPHCYILKRRVVTAYGNVLVRRTRVCE